MFSINHGKIAFSMTKILKAAQRTHTSNVPRSPLPNTPFGFHPTPWMLKDYVLNNPRVSSLTNEIVQNRSLRVRDRLKLSEMLLGKN